MPEEEHAVIEGDGIAEEEIAAAEPTGQTAPVEEDIEASEETGPRTEGVGEEAESDETTVDEVGSSLSVLPPGCDFCFGVSLSDTEPSLVGREFAVFPIYWCGDEPLRNRTHMIEIAFQQETTGARVTTDRGPLGSVSVRFPTQGVWEPITIADGMGFTAPSFAGWSPQSRSRQSIFARRSISA